MLTQEQKNMFREIWKQRFGREISDEDADREANRLVRIVQLICKPTVAGGDEDTEKRKGAEQPK
jgi:hypothetical protein